MTSLTVRDAATREIIETIPVSSQAAALWQSETTTMRSIYRQSERYPSDIVGWVNSQLQRIADQTEREAYMTRRVVIADENRY